VLAAELAGEALEQLAVESAIEALVEVDAFEGNAGDFGDGFLDLRLVGALLDEDLGQAASRALLEHALGDGELLGGDDVLGQEGLAELLDGAGVLGASGL
jgi:hypothetical protein